MVASISGLTVSRFWKRVNITSKSPQQPGEMVAARYSPPYTPISLSGSTTTTSSGSRSSTAGSSPAATIAANTGASLNPGRLLPVSASKAACDPHTTVRPGTSTSRSDAACEPACEPDWSSAPDPNAVPATSSVNPTANADRTNCVIPLPPRVSVSWWPQSPGTKPSQFIRDGRGHQSSGQAAGLKSLRSPRVNA